MNPNDQQAVPGTGGHGEIPGSNAAPSPAPIAQPPQQAPPQQQPGPQQAGPQQGRPQQHAQRPSAVDIISNKLTGSPENQPDHRDDVWVDRAKRAIAETQNDPYRQVQLLQHLNRLYLKERFNRDVHSEDKK